MTLLTSTSVTSDRSTSRSARRWLALSILALAQFLVVLDASIVNIALPVLGEQLDMTTAALAWVVTAYVLAFGGLLLLGGRLADRFGHRRVFLIGISGFVAASALAGLSASSEVLLAARALQGTSAALLAPAALALLTLLFPETKARTKALGVWGAVAGIGSAAGVLLGGVLTASFGWQAVFFVNVPVGALVLIVIPLLITRDDAAAKNRLDIPGAVTVTAALVALVGAFSAVEQQGFFHPVPFVLLVAAFAFGIAFVIIERRAAAPLVPLDVFRNRDLALGNLVMLLFGAVTVALFFALSVYMQAILEYDAMTAGLAQLPLAGALVVIAGVVPALIARLGTRPVLLGSLLVLAAGLAWLAAAPADAVFVTQILGPTLLIGVGLGGGFIATTQLGVEGVEGGEAGLAGGLINTSQQFGGALGIALLGTIAGLRTTALEERGAAPVDALAGGFSWLFLSAAVLSIAGGTAVAVWRRVQTTPRGGSSAGDQA
ncbi:DHA2 family efflux MFS transporter permease subunit [Microbacterium sp. Sa4CUA7]|uniref:DHA2 family efflux MFS transporter permease subunit n=1 Tax=Microbacterium pullorum TaxID=2762236 RepID=A0ABR8RZ19_9MICO|nr:DHA2 family efflux MFS transporter permease subunit [Microbacterium pullorum]MBD7956485.1 DHA2 family efflux MFS transporter permease subunit [Microbacterium pullorum]